MAAAGTASSCARQTSRSWVRLACARGAREPGGYGTPAPCVGRAQGDHQSRLLISRDREITAHCSRDGMYLGMWYGPAPSLGLGAGVREGVKQKGFLSSLSRVSGSHGRTTRRLEAAPGYRPEGWLAYPARTATAKEGSRTPQTCRKQGTSRSTSFSPTSAAAHVHAFQESVASFLFIFFVFRLHLVFLVVFPKHRVGNVSYKRLVPTGVRVPSARRPGGSERMWEDGDL